MTALIAIWLIGAIITFIIGIVIQASDPLGQANPLWSLLAAVFWPLVVIVILLDLVFGWSK